MTNSMDKVEDIVGRLRMSALAIREVERCSPAYLGTGSQIEVAADLIQSQQALIEEMREALKVFGSASDNFDKFWAEETGGQKQIDDDEDEMTTFFTLGVDLHMAPLSAYRRAKALSQKDQIDG